MYDTPLIFVFGVFPFCPEICLKWLGNAKVMKRLHRLTLFQWNSKRNPLLTFLYRIIIICAVRCRSREFVRGGGSSGGASSVSRGGRAPSYPTRGSRSLSNRGSGRGKWRDQASLIHSQSGDLFIDVLRNIHTSRSVRAPYSLHKLRLSLDMRNHLENVLTTETWKPSPYGRYWKTKCSLLSYHCVSPWWWLNIFAIFLSPAWHCQTVAAEPNIIM